MAEDGDVTERRRKFWTKGDGCTAFKLSINKRWKDRTEREASEHGVVDCDGEVAYNAEE